MDRYELTYWVVTIAFFGAMLIPVGMAIYDAITCDYKCKMERTCSDFCQKFGYSGITSFISSYETCNNSVLKGTAYCLCFSGKDELAIVVPFKYTFYNWNCEKK